MTKRGLSRAALDRMHATLSAYVAKGDLPGVVTAVAHGDETHVDVIGTMAPGALALRRDTIFRISSMSKPVTGAATMLLVEDGILKIDDPVDRLLPELAHRRVLKNVEGPLEDTVPAKRPITVRDLLTFTLGFGVLFADPESVPILKAANAQQIGMGPPMPAVMPPPDEWIRRLGSLPLMYQPGERWMYNTGADVLSVLIARASGKPLDVFLRERLFAPLGMKDTAFYVPEEKMDRLPPSRWRNYMTGKEEVFDEARGGQWSRPPAFPSGAGGLVSTVDDFLAFARMMLNGGLHGKERILSAGSVRAMTKNHLTKDQEGSELVPGYWDNHGWGYCLSMLTAADELTSKPGRYGWEGGMGSSWFNDPNEDLAAILMTPRMMNGPDPPAHFRAFWKSAYEAVRE